MSACQIAGLVIVIWGVLCFIFAALTGDQPRYWFKR